MNTVQEYMKQKGSSFQGTDISEDTDILSQFQFSAKHFILQDLQLNLARLKNRGPDFGSFKHFYSPTFNPQTVSQNLIYFTHYGYLQWCETAGHNPESLGEFILRIKKALEKAKKRISGLAHQSDFQEPLMIDETLDIIHQSLSHWEGELAPPETL